MNERKDNLLILVNLVELLLPKKSGVKGADLTL